MQVCIYIYNENNYMSRDLNDRKGSLYGAFAPDVIGLENDRGG